MTSEDGKNLEVLIRRIEAGSCTLFAGTGCSVKSGAPTAPALA
jgi:hypothetical protein